MPLAQIRLRVLRRLVIFFCICATLLGCASHDSGARRSKPPVGVAIDRITFRSNAGEAFAALLYSPPPETRSGLGVLLIGGGLGNDLNWTVPGRIEGPDGSQQVTISGASHADAPRIARALAERGHVVMHWSTIAVGDPLANEYPMRMTPRSPSELVALTRDAVAALRAHGDFDPRRVILIGHSMGGQRAVVVAAEDDGVCALVLLASAQATWGGPGDRGRNIHRAAVLALIESSDSDGDRLMSRAEFYAAERTKIAPALASFTFDDIDLDRDGFARLWELSGVFALRARDASAGEPHPRADGSGIAWTEDALAEVSRSRTLPTLFLYGGLDDAQAHHAPVLARLISDGTLKTAELRILPGVGHSLGVERDGLTGPIDERVIDAIAEWIGAIG